VIELVAVEPYNLEVLPMMVAVTGNAGFSFDGNG
jgi:hypothetical protein